MTKWRVAVVELALALFVNVINDDYDDDDAYNAYRDARVYRIHESVNGFRRIVKLHGNVLCECVLYVHQIIHAL